MARLGLTEKYLRYWQQTKPGDAMGKSFQDIKLNPDLPCPTILKSANIAHWAVPRWLAVSELNACASFPPPFQFAPGDNAIARIGNTVPPLFMRAIASDVLATIFPEHTMPTLDFYANNGQLRPYRDVLTDAWALHMAPRAANAPTVISTFAGCGGSSLGYSMAGYKELLAVEWDAHAVETFKLNFPEVPVYHGDIAALSVEEVLERTGLQPGELDVFDGSPPCQGFSTAGNRNMNDERNTLFLEYVRLLRGLKPKAFIMENVSGMVKGKMRLIFVDILRALKASGYTVSARLLNAKYFGVPQSRVRIIFIGIRTDLAITPTHPAPITRGITVREALNGVVNDESEVAALRAAGEKYRAYKRWHTLQPGQSDFNNIRLAFDAVAPTIVKFNGEIGAKGMMMPHEPRRPSQEETKRLTSLPVLFQFAQSLDTTGINHRLATWAESMQRMGNIVPPLLMYAVAEHIRLSLYPAEVI